VGEPEQGGGEASPASFPAATMYVMPAAIGQLWTIIFAHAAFDVTAVAIIYWDVESAVAHLLFK
jgi:hypothetical protein